MGLILHVVSLIKACCFFSNPLPRKH